MSQCIGQTILVCGISGVGKTRLLDDVVKLLPSVVVWRASEIIGAARNILDPEALRTLPAGEILQSQVLLVQGFEVQRREFPDSLVLLDAHSVIDSDNGLIEIPIEVAAHFMPTGILHVSDEPARILERRLADTKRVRPARSLGQLTEYQRRSIAVCEGYSVALDVPLIEIRSGDIGGFTKAIRSVVARSPRTG
jgi:adenylate kinase